MSPDRDNTARQATMWAAEVGNGATISGLIVHVTRTVLTEHRQAIVGTESTRGGNRW